MRLAAILAMTISIALAAQAGAGVKHRVIVYVRNSANVPEEVVTQAENLASTMFLPVGVRIDWRCGKPSGAGSRDVAIELDKNAPNEFVPGALAYAKPYEGVRIVVFWDRIELGVSADRLLAHVLVHEIAHILQGVSQHSDEGIMKARWSEEDQKIMHRGLLTFAERDKNLIRAALDRSGK